MQKSQPLTAVFGQGMQHETEHQLRVLDEQIQQFRRESEALRRLREQSELAEQQLALEREQFFCESQAERQALRAEACAERQAVQESRKQLEAEMEHQRLAAASERLELRAQVDRLQEDLESRQQEWHQSAKGLERQVQDLARTNRSLTEELVEARQGRQPGIVERGAAAVSHTPPARRRWRNSRVASSSAAHPPRPQTSFQQPSACGHQRDAAAQTGPFGTSSPSHAHGASAGSGPLPSALPLTLGALDEGATKPNAEPAAGPRAPQVSQQQQPSRLQTLLAERVWREPHGLETSAEAAQTVQLTVNGLDDLSKQLPGRPDTPGEMPQPLMATVPHLPRSIRQGNAFCGDDAPFMTAVAKLHEDACPACPTEQADAPGARERRPCLLQASSSHGLSGAGTGTVATSVCDSEGTSHGSQDVVLREARNAEGRVERCFLDGRREIVFPNGLQKTVWADGRAAVHFQNGDVKESLRDGTVVYRYCATRTVQTTYTDGTNVYCFASGQTERHQLDGSKEVTFPDGTRRSVAADGSEVICFANGAVRRTPAVGTASREDGNHS